MPEVVQEDTVDDRSATAAVLEAARALGPAFEAATRQAEVERTLPQSVVEQMREAGLFWLKTPKSLGGSELDPVGFCDVVEEIAYHDASAAWAVMIGNGVTGTFAGWLPDEGVEDLFPEGGPLPIMAGQFVPRGVAVAVPGGYRVTGRWSFSSGIMHSSWVAGAARVEGGEPGEEILLCVPKSSATVHDIWFVAGLEGTGSNDFSLEDVFVPASHTRRRADAPPQRGGPLFRQPQSLFVANEITPVAVGIARRALDDIVVLARATVRGATGVPLIDRAAFQKTLGRAEAKWLAARLVYRAAVQEAWDRSVEGLPFDDGIVATLRSRHTFAVETCTELVAEVFRYGGGRVLALNNPMQRHYRNLIAATQHVANTEENYELAAMAIVERSDDES
ncbi:MAG: hypothetical protein BGO95_04605 [Micrococcales bacterium 73-13]|nr:MAG: hypothetical protein BGO95_04605 [Micrococcales bacterium 73-13]